MGDMKDAFPSYEERQRMNNRNKIRKQKTNDKAWMALSEWCPSHVEMREMTNACFRLVNTLDNIKIDWYPYSLKYHNITKDKRGIASIEVIKKMVLGEEVIQKDPKEDPQNVLGHLLMLCQEYLPEFHPIKKSNHYKYALKITGLSDEATT